MAQPTDEEMFAWHEQDRALASAMTNEELARYLLDNVIGAVVMAEQSRGGDWNKECGAVREAAYRLAGLRE